MTAVVSAVGCRPLLGLLRRCCINGRGGGTSAKFGCVTKRRKRRYRLRNWPDYNADLLPAAEGCLPPAAARHRGARSLPPLAARCRAAGARPHDALAPRPPPPPEPPLGPRPEDPPPGRRLDRPEALRRRRVEGPPLWAGAAPDLAQAPPRRGRLDAPGRRRRGHREGGHRPAGTPAAARAGRGAGRARLRRRGLRTRAAATRPSTSRAHAQSPRR